VNHTIINFSIFSFSNLSVHYDGLSLGIWSLLQGDQILKAKKRDTFTNDVVSDLQQVISPILF
jgi:hypothetical protein